jgi:tetratricopeptide (TPR) repeat protein
MSIKAAGEKFKAGKLQEAAVMYEKFLALEPNNPDALHNLGVIAAQFQRPDIAIELIRRSLIHRPNYPEGFKNLALILKQQGNLKDAKQLLHSALSLDPKNSICRYQLGSILYQQKLLIEAENTINIAIQYDSNNYLAYNLLGVILQDQGLLEKAIKKYRKAIRINPDYYDAYYNLSNIKKFSKDDSDLKSLKNISSKIKTIDNPNTAKIFYSLGKAYNDINNYSAAFECFLKANQCDRKFLEYNRKSEEGMLKKIASIFSKKFITQHENSACQSKTPVFVLGMPRSGTSLVEQILASHPQINGAGERMKLYQLASNITKFTSTNTAYPESLALLNDEICRDIGEEYLMSLQETSSDSDYIIDKMPSNFMLIGLIHLVLPNAKIIHCVRNPIDTCFSCFRTNFTIGHNYSNTLEDLGSYYQHYLALMSHWRNVLPSKILDIEYESLVNDTEKNTRSMLEYLGLDWNDACLNYHENNRTVQTASAWQVRQPIYNSSIRGWKNYEAHLQPLIQALNL